jgi:hypothetical protein
MKKKRIIIIAAVSVAVLLLGLVAWVFWGWYNGPHRAIAEREKLVQEDLKMWSTTISFYGTVLDEKGNPVPQAKLGFLITDSSRKGTSEYEVQSDQKGSFSLTGVKGYHVEVTASKQGYYRGKGSFQSFYSAGSGRNLPSDPKNPAIFHLRKKGEAAALIYKGNNFDVSLDGTPCEVNLYECQIVSPGQGHIRVECRAGDQKVRYYDWLCRISVPNGGLVIIARDNEFPLEAPTDG